MLSSLVNPLFRINLYSLLKIGAWNGKVLLPFWSQARVYALKYLAKPRLEGAPTSYFWASRGEMLRN